MSNLWVNKYAPKTISEVVGNSSKIRTLETWIKNYKNKKPGTKKVALISGKPGIGKTTLAKLLLTEYGYTPIEFNSSDIRGAKKIRNVLKKSLTYMNIIDMFNKGTKPIGIIMDELDGLSSDKGGMTEFLNIIKSDLSIKTRKKKTNNINLYNPIICTFNPYSDKKLKELEKYSIRINLSKIPSFELEKIVDKILINEKMNIDIDAKIFLVKNANGDVRRLINLLYDLSFVHKHITLKIVQNQKKSFAQKDTDIQLYDAVKLLLNKRLSINKVYQLYEHECLLIPLMIHENHLDYVINSKNSNTDKLSVLKNISNSICENDVIQTSIFVNQSWSLLDISGVYGANIPNYEITRLEKKQNSKPVSINFTKLLNKVSLMYNNKKIIINTIANNKHLRVKHDDIPYLIELIRYNLFDKNGDINKICNILKKYKINVNDLETILKLEKLNNYNKKRKNKKFTVKLKNKIKKLI